MIGNDPPIRQAKTLLAQKQELDEDQKNKEESFNFSSVHASMTHPRRGRSLKHLLKTVIAKDAKSSLQINSSRFKGVRESYQN